MTPPQGQMQAEGRHRATADPTASPHELIASDRAEGTNVYRSDGTKIGYIERIMMDKRSGQAPYAVMVFGRFLGLAEDSCPLPWSVLTYNTSSLAATKSTSRRATQSAPHLRSGGNWDDGNRPRHDDLRRLRRAALLA